MHDYNLVVSELMIHNHYGKAKEIANKYGVMKEKNMYGKKVMGVARTTFVIENGKITKIFNNVKPEGHAEEVLAAV